MKYNSRTIYGCTMAEPGITAPADCRYTQSADGSRLYLHLFAYPFAHLRLPGMAGKVEYAQFLHDGSELLFTKGAIDHFSAKKRNGGQQRPDSLPSCRKALQPGACCGADS